MKCWLKDINQQLNGGALIDSKLGSLLATSSLQLLQTVLKHYVMCQRLIIMYVLFLLFALYLHKKDQI